MDFDAFMTRAWDDHATDAAGVAQRLHAQGLGLLQTDAQIPRLANLAHHVFGEHLGRWPQGLQFIDALRALPFLEPAGDTAMSLRRCSASLQLAGGGVEATEGFGDSDRIRVLAMAAASLTGHDTPRAQSLFQQALALADAAALPDADPAIRALAVTANNLAATLEEKAGRSVDERALMVLTAQVARRCWGRAGGWLETERAEWRLSKVWLQAGDAARAAEHARLCLDIVQANGGAALERLFAWEATGLACLAAGDTAGHAQAALQAQAAFDALDDGDKGWCRESIDTLKAAGAPQH